MFARQLLKTNVVHRPFPSLFFSPGINTQPYHDTSKFSFVNEFENNKDTIKVEYLALKAAYGRRDDYVKVSNEHTLSQGEWHWMNYVAKGLK